MAPGNTVVVGAGRGDEGLALTCFNTEQPPGKVQA